MNTLLQASKCGMGPLGPLFTDLYELTMMAGYYESGKSEQPAVFEYVFRDLPPNAGFAIFAGLDDLLDDLSDFHFSNDEIEYLQSLKLFPPDFAERLRSFRFEGDLWSVPEGTAVFPEEPIVRVQGPLAQVQIIETLLLCRLNYQTLIATKASRVRLAAEADPVMEFGLRRAQGPDGGMSGSRAAIIGGADSTSNTLAAKCFGVPPVGTQAHSWIMAFPTELEAFRAYASVFPDHLILLVDTYDTLSSGMPNAIQVFQELRAKGWKGRPGVRVDSGDLAKLSTAAYEMLVKAGFDNPLIVASSDLDENLIANIKRSGGKANAWGVGTKLMTGGAHSALGGVYKLAAILEGTEWVSRLKISDDPKKSTDPGIKLPIRFYDPDGFIAGDVLFDDSDRSWETGEVTSHDRATSSIRRFPESFPRCPIMEPVMKGGRRLFASRQVREIRSFAKEQIARIQIEMRRLENPPAYSIGLSSHIAERKRTQIEAFRASLGI